MSPGASSDQMELSDRIEVLAYKVLGQIYPSEWRDIALVVEYDFKAFELRMPQIGYLAVAGIGMRIPEML